MLFQGARSNGQLSQVLTGVGKAEVHSIAMLPRQHTGRACVCLRNTHACAQGALCSRFGIGHYPTLRFGRPADFEAGKEKALEEYSGVKGEREIIEWVGKQMSS